MSSLVNAPVAAFIYVLLILVTSLFMLRVSPGTLIRGIWRLIRGDKTEDQANGDIMRKAAGDDTKSGSMADFKLNAGVPMLTPAEQKKLSSLKNSRCV